MKLVALDHLAIGTILLSRDRSTLKAPAALSSQGEGWPRVYTEGPAKVTVYQPQTNSWIDYKTISARFAVALTPPRRRTQPAYRAILVEVDSLVDNQAAGGIMPMLASAKLAPSTQPGTPPSASHRQPVEGRSSSGAASISELKRE